MERPPCALLYHRPTGALFEVNRLRRERSTGQYYVSDTAAPDPDASGEWEGFPLSDCALATLSQFQRPCWVKQSGSAVLVTDVRGVTLQTNEAACWLELEPVYLAACALTSSFNGAVIGMEAAYDNHPQWAIKAEDGADPDTLSPLHQQELLLWEAIESQ